MINCSAHPQREASGACVYCGKFFCEDCLVEIDHKFYCKEHVKMLVNTPYQGQPPYQSDTPYQNNPPYQNDTPYQNNPPYQSYPPVQNIYVNNSNVNQQQTGYGPGYFYHPKNRGVAILLCLFFGWGGFHRFYTGKIGTGILWFFTGGFFCIGWGIDLLLLILGVFRDANGQRLV